MMAFGQPVNTIYDFSKADEFFRSMLISFRRIRERCVTRATSRRDAAVEFDHEEAQSREDEPALRGRDDADDTGAAADHHWAVKPSELLKAATAIAALCRCASVTATETTTAVARRDCARSASSTKARAS